MIKIIKVLGTLGVITIIGASSALAFDRNAAVAGTRVISISNFNYNIPARIATQSVAGGNSVNISLNSGPTMVGSTNHTLPAYQSIAQTIAQIEALKQQLKNLSFK